MLAEPGSEHDKRAAEVRDHISETLAEEVELIAWLDGERVAVRRGSCELRFAPGGDVSDRRGGTWTLDGDLAALTGTVHEGLFTSADYPDALARLWAALRNPNAGDVLLSLAPDWECVDWGGVTHIPGGSHGSLRAADSLGTLLTVGLDGERPEREQWAISDVADLIAGHFGIGARRTRGARDRRLRLDAVSPPASSDEAFVIASPRGCGLVRHAGVGGAGGNGSACRDGRRDACAQPRAEAATETFEYTGAEQTWTVPEGVTSATFDVYGAEGGRNINGGGWASGGRATAEFAVTPGTTYEVNVGEAGGLLRLRPARPYGGGGAGGTGTRSSGVFYGASGGGASDVRPWEADSPSA